MPKRKKKSEIKSTVVTNPIREVFVIAEKPHH